MGPRQEALHAREVDAFHAFPQDQRVLAMKLLIKRRAIGNAHPVAADNPISVRELFADLGNNLEEQVDALAVNKTRHDNESD